MIYMQNTRINRLRLQWSVQGSQKCSSSQTTIKTDYNRYNLLHTFSMVASCSLLSTENCIQSVDITLCGYKYQHEV